MNQNRRRSLLAGALVVALCGSTVTAARAGGDLTAASRAFQAAQAATLSGDHVRAAELYELADEIVGSPEALRSAARARESAGNLATAATHAESLLRRYLDDEKSAALARQMLRRLGPELVRIRIKCRPACAVAADSQSVASDPRSQHVFYLRPGNHILIASFADGRESRYALAGEETVAGSTAKVELSAPVDDPPPSMERRVGDESTLKPPRASWSNRKRTVVVIAAGSAATIGLAVAATWSGLETLGARDDFLAAPTDDLFRAGKHKQLRTNLLIGATGIVAVGTIATTLLLRQRWHERDSSVDVEVSGDTASISWGSSF